MIDNNAITPGNFIPPLQSWTLQSHLSNAILIALLTTLLSYQLTAALFDLVLGFKPRGVVTAPDLHIQLLSSEASPLSLCAATLRRDALDRLRFRRKIPSYIPLQRVEDTIALPQILKLATLVVAAPLFNLLSVALTVEREQSVSFAAAGFKGVSLGVNSDLSVVAEDVNYGSCARLKLTLDESVRPAAHFLKCRTGWGVSYFPSDSNDDSLAKIVVATTLRGTVSVDLFATLTVNGSPARVWQYRAEDYASILAAGESFRLKQSLDVEMAKRLVNQGISLLKNERFRHRCDVSSATEPKVVAIGELVTVTTKFNCSAANLDSRFAGLLVRSVANSATLIESDELRVVREQDIPRNQSVHPVFVNRDDITFLIRRGKIVSQGALCVVVAVILGLRVLIRMRTHNDVENVMEDVMKSALGVPRSCSLLWETITVRYNHRYQVGEYVHYGVERPGMEEVRKFKRVELTKDSGKSKTGTSEEDVVG